MSGRLCSEDLDLSKLPTPAMQLLQRQGLGSPEEKDQKDVHSRHMGEGVLTPGSRAGSTLTATTWRRMCYLISRGGRTTQPPRRAETQAGWPALPQAWWKRLIGRGQLRGCLNSGQWSEKVRMSPEWPIPHRDTCTMSAQAPSVPTRILKVAGQG